MYAFPFLLFILILFPVLVLIFVLFRLLFLFFLLICFVSFSHPYSYSSSYSSSYSFSLLLSSSPLGPEAASAMREKGFTGIIIGVTGHAQAEDIAAFERCGADIVLAKPLRFEVLMKVVNRLTAPAS